MKKGFTLIELLVLIAILGILGVVFFGGSDKAEACGFFTECPKENALTTSNNINASIERNIPVPQLTTSSERKNVAKRAELFNNEEKISYIYLVSYGKVMAFFPVQGKVSSLQSYMTPTEKLIKYNGEDCNTLTSYCEVVSAPDIDGTYGENVEGIFFFTTEGAYVEWKGEYMMSDQPLKLATPPELVREIK